jgi:hypothetical protein
MKLNGNNDNPTVGTMFFAVFGFASPLPNSFPIVTGRDNIPPETIALRGLIMLTV